MFDLVSSWLLAIWPSPSDPQVLRPVNLSAWVQQANVKSLLEPSYTPDVGAIAAIQKHLDSVTKQGVQIDQQGIWFQSGRNVLAEHQGTQPFPAASLTKLATTLAALDTWGTEYQFKTLFGYRGVIENGVLNGDLIVQGGGDPFFVWEEAIAVGNALNAAGIKTVTGDLVITGSFAMNYKDDPLTAGGLLQRGMNAELWTQEARQQFAGMPPGTQRPSVSIRGEVVVRSGQAFSESDRARDGGGSDGGIAFDRVENGSSPSASTTEAIPIVRHYSVPLVEMLRQMNIYSNNFMAEALAQELGGADVVAQRAAAIALVPQEEIQLVNGSGLGVENRISARATCAMLIAIQGLLNDFNWSVADVLPVVGLDEGTIRDRELPSLAAVKTGTLATVSALAGAIPTTDPSKDVIWFAVINWGNDLADLRTQQDQLLKAVVQTHEGGGAIARSTVPRGSGLMLGAPERSEILATF